MKIFNAFRTFVVVVIVLVTASIMISFLFPGPNRSESKEAVVEDIAEQELPMENSDWFPIPVVEVEKDQRYHDHPYWIVLENGLSFYSAEKMTVGQPGAWINNQDSIVFSDPNKN